MQRFEYYPLLLEYSSNIYKAIQSIFRVTEGTQADLSKFGLVGQHRQTIKAAMLRLKQLLENDENQGGLADRLDAVRRARKLYTYEVATTICISAT